MDQICSWQRDAYEISTDKARIDREAVCAFLATAYWAAQRPREVTLRAIDHSLVFGVYHSAQQIGFARVTTDYATFAYIGDVFIVPSFRGQGLSKWLIACVLDHPELQGLRRWLLATRDAHGLYAQFGFRELVYPERWMERPAPSAYDLPAVSEEGAHNGATDRSS